jgi:hypothetical protein
MVVVEMQVITPLWHSMSYFYDTLGVLSSHLDVDWLVLAQNVQDPDLLVKYKIHGIILLNLVKSGHY